MALRVHAKDSRSLLEYLGRNKRDFQIENTSTGFPTFNVSGKAIYVRDKVIHRGTLNKILQFHNQVSKSNVYKFVSNGNENDIIKESQELERSLIYKAFTFNPVTEKSFEKVIKIDFNTAYWQTCRYFKAIDRALYKDINDNCTKETRLRITGTLGKKNILTDYVKGNKQKSYFKEESKRRIVFQNIYNRIRKFVDELMVWCCKQNPNNFLGYYVDCVWLREYDLNLIDELEKIYKLKIEVVDLEIISNASGKIVLCEENEENSESKIYDAQFKYNEFVIYKNLYNFTPNLGGINLKVKMTENENNVAGQNDSPDAQNVKTEQVEAQVNQPVEPQDLDVTGENSVVEEQVETRFDPDEKILSDMFDSGKIEVTTNDLIVAGFDTSRMASYTFQVGSFKLSRLLLVSPYKIEKTQQ